MSAERRRIETWVEQGIITSDQAGKIHEFEDRESPQRSIALEILGYVGATLVLAAGMALMSNTWPDLERGVRLSILLAGTGLLTWAGMSGISDRGDPMRRLGQTALMLAVPAIGVAARIATDDVIPGRSVIVGFIVASGVAVILYLRSPSYPQHIVLFTAIIGLAVNLALRPLSSTESLFVSLAFLGVGLMWVSLTTVGWLTARTLGEVLGGGAAVVGSVIMVATVESSAPAMVGFITASVGVIWFSLSRNRTAVLVTGMIGIVLYVPWLITETLGDSVGTPIALFTAGALLIGSAIFLMRTETRKPLDDTKINPSENP